MAAAEPPSGVVLDGTATVLVRSVSDPDDGPSQPPPAMLVTVVTYVTDFPEAPPLQPPLTATTGPDGRAAFAGVARPAEPGVAVRMAVDAFRQAELPGPGRCTTTEVWAGSAGDIAWPPPEPIIVEAVRTARVVCPEVPVLEGRLLDGRGDPLVVDRAWATIGVVGGAVETLPLAVGADGAFAIELPAIGTFLERATLAVHAIGSATRTVPFGTGCLRTVADEVAWSRSVALAEGETLDPVELTAVETVVGERCGTTASGLPAPDATPPAVGPAPSRSVEPTRSPGSATVPVAATNQRESVVPSAGATAEPTATPSARVAGRTFVPDASDPAAAAGGRLQPPQPRPAAPHSLGLTAAPPAAPVAVLGAAMLMWATLVLAARRLRRRDATGRPQRRGPATRAGS